MRFIYRIIQVIILFVCLPLFTYSQQQFEVYNFEDTNQLHLWVSEKYNTNSIQLSKAHHFDGQQSLRFELNKNDSMMFNGKRAEIHKGNFPSQEGVFEFSIFLPKSFKTDTLPEILAQWHETPDFNLGETWRSPPIALSVQNAHWFVTIMWSKNQVNTNKTIDGKKVFDLGEVRLNKWTTWNFRIKFSYKNEGLLEVYQNKKLLEKYGGPNSYNDNKFPYFKIGIYKWMWNHPSSETLTSKRVVYFDAVKITAVTDPH